MEFEKLQAIIAEVMGIDNDEVTLESSFREDLDANSLDLMEIVMRMEEELAIQVPDEKLEGIVTVGDALNVINASI